MKLNQCRNNTQEVINCIKSMPNKKSTVLEFETVEFYPFITENLLDNAVF